jgi:hypothetical protein
VEHDDRGEIQRVLGYERWQLWLAKSFFHEHCVEDYTRVEGYRRDLGVICDDNETSAFALVSGDTFVNTHQS